MSEPETIDAFIQQAILNYGTVPLAPDGALAWNRAVAMAYSRLCLSPDFRLVLEDWTKEVLLNPDAEAGERRFVLKVLGRLRGIQQLQRQQT